MKKILLPLCIAASIFACKSTPINDLNRYKSSLPKISRTISENNPSRIFLNDRSIDELILKNNNVLIAYHDLETKRAQYDMERATYGLKSSLNIIPLRKFEDGNYSNTIVIDFSLNQEFSRGGNFQTYNTETFLPQNDRENDFVLRFSLPLPFSSHSAERQLTVLTQLHKLNEANNIYISQVRGKHREVKERFYEFDYRKARAEIAQEFLSQLENLSSIINAKNDEQTTREYKTDLSQARSDVDSKVSRKNNSEIDFKSSLGLSIDSVFENDVVVEFEECELDMSSIENEVIELDPDINTLASQSLVAKEQLRASRLKKFPDVYFIGEYGRSSDSSEQDNFSLGLGFELNLFDSGQNNALQREANNILRVSELKIDQRLNDLLSATKREMLNIEESEQRYLKLLEIVGNARESYYGAVKLFEREGITYSETKRLLETYTDSKDDLREALRDYSQAKSRLEIMIGNSDGT